MSDEPILSMFGLGTAPTAMPTPAAPTKDEAYERARKESERSGLLRRALGQQRRDTVLTTSQGDISPATVQRVSVLGGTS